MSQAGGIVALNAEDDRLLRLGEACGTSGADLQRPSDWGHIQDARSWLVGLTAGVDVFQVSPCLGEESELARHSACLVGDLTRPDVNPIQPETHGAALPLGARLGSDIKGIILPWRVSGQRQVEIATGSDEEWYRRYGDYRCGLPRGFPQ
jgi:hypothetical protein